MRTQPGKADELQAPRPDQPRHTEHQRRPEFAMGQWTQTFVEHGFGDQEQRTTQPLHSESCEHKCPRRQAQTDQQRDQPGQCPTDRRAMGEEKQRRQQVKERQTETRQHRQAFALPRRRLLGLRFMQLIETEQQRDTQHQRTQRCAFEQAALAIAQLAKKHQRRAQLQQQGKGSGQRPLLTQSQPQDPRALHCPCGGGPARIKPQGNRQAGEDHAQGQAGFRQQQRATGEQQTGQAHVNDAQRQGTERGGEFQMLHQCELQTEAHQGRTEQQRAVDVITLARRPVQQRLAATILRCIAHFQQLASGEQQTDSQVHQEEQNQERLSAPQQLRRIGPCTPGETDAERADETDHVQQAPCLEPGDAEDTGVEQGEIAEQRYMASAARGGQDGRGEATQCCH
ncbi:hypothetical protein D3C71_947340 [compost metagenome]